MGEVEGGGVSKEKAGVKIRSNERDEKCGRRLRGMRNNKQLMIVTIRINIYISIDL